MEDGLKELQKILPGAEGFDFDGYFEDAPKENTVKAEAGGGLCNKMIRVSEGVRSELTRRVLQKKLAGDSRASYDSVIRELLEEISA